MIVDHSRVEDICDFIGGSQPAKSEFINEPKDGYVRLIQTRDYKTDAFPTYIPENSTRKFCDVDDVMIGRYGPPIFQICRGLKGAYNVALLKAKPKKGIDREFLYYFLKQDAVFQYVDKLSARTGGQTGVDLVSLNKYPVRVPTNIGDQKKLVASLVAIDKKIELNNRINAELDVMAKTLYNYWFVQFDFPDANGKPYKSSGGKMVYDPALKRKIPEGWEAKPLSKLLNCNRAKLGKKHQLKVLNYLDTANLTNNTIGSIQKLVVGVDTVPSRANMIVNKNDILYSTVRPNQFHYGIVRDPVDHLVASTGFAVLSHKENSEFNTMFYLHITSSQNTNKLIRISESSKSSYPSISPDDILNLVISLPFDTEIIKKFCKLLNPMFDKMSEIQKEAKELEKLRDWLIPMLMNGQVTVK
ncbi:restriction endonuclease subunit S [Vibrio mimicus]